MQGDRARPGRLGLVGARCRTLGQRAPERAPPTTGARPPRRLTPLQVVVGEVSYWGDTGCPQKLDGPTWRALLSGAPQQTCIEYPLYAR